jgi:hypothetical protein
VASGPGSGPGAAGRLRSPRARGGTKATASSTEQALGHWPLYFVVAWRLAERDNVCVCARGAAAVRQRRNGASERARHSCEISGGVHVATRDKSLFWSPSHAYALIQQKVPLNSFLNSLTIFKAREKRHIDSLIFYVFCRPFHHYILSQWFFLAIL